MNLSHVDNSFTPELLQFRLGNVIAVLNRVNMHHSSFIASLCRPYPLTLPAGREDPPAQISHLPTALLPVLGTVGQRDEPAPAVLALLPGDDAGADSRAPYTAGLTATGVAVSGVHLPTEYSDECEVLQPAGMYRIGPISHPPIHSKGQEKRDS